MTNEELQAHIKALNEASARGEIEYIGNNGWSVRCGVMLTPDKYRIKPQPREVWICKCGEVSQDPDFVPPRDGDMVTGHAWRKFREVIE